MSKSKESESSSSYYSSSSDVSYEEDLSRDSSSEEGSAQVSSPKKKKRRRRLMMLFNTIGLTLIVLVIVTSLSLSSSSEESPSLWRSGNGSLVYDNASSTTIEPLPVPEARHSNKRKFVAFMPISVDRGNFESFSGLEYFDEDDREEYDYSSREIEENRFGAVGVRRRKNKYIRNPISRPKNPYRKKLLQSTLSLPRIKNRAKLDYLYQKKMIQKKLSDKYSNLPALHKRPGPPYLTPYKRASTSKRRIAQLRSSKRKANKKSNVKKKNTSSTLIIIDKRNKKKKKSSVKKDVRNPSSSSKGNHLTIKRRRKLKQELHDARISQNNRERQKMEYSHPPDSKNRLLKSPIRRPPPRHPGVRIPGVQYPPNSGSIRDIIDYMHQREDPELESHAAGIYQTAEKGYFYPDPRNESWVAYQTSDPRADFPPLAYANNKNNIPSRNPSSQGVPAKYFDPNKYNYVFLPATTKPPVLAIKRPDVYDRRVQIHQNVPIPSLGYDPSHPDGPDYSEVTTLKKSSGPLSIGLDVYPIRGHPSKSSSSHISSRHGSKKQEVLLHLNLFSNSPLKTKTSSSSTPYKPAPTPLKGTYYPQKPNLPSSYYYFSTPGSQHGDNMYHPAQSSTSSVKAPNRKETYTNARTDDGTNAEDILKYLASSINEGNFRIGNHEVKISTNLSNATSYSKDEPSKYKNHRLEDSYDQQREKEAKESVRHESTQSFAPHDSALSTTSIVETYQKPLESSPPTNPPSASAPSPNKETQETDEEDFEYYYQYYYDYVYPEELEKHNNASRQG